LLVTVNSTSDCCPEFRICKGNVVSVHVVKAHGRSRSIAPLILNLGTRWRRIVSHTPRPIYSQSGLNILSTDRQTDRYSACTENWPNPEDGYTETDPNEV